MEKYLRNSTSELNQVIRLIVWSLIVVSFLYAILFNNRLFALIAIGLLGIELFIQGIKLFVNSTIGINSITSRPKGAKDCGAFIDCKKADTTTMGMPSGHSMSMGFFATFMILVTNPKNAYSYIVVLLALAVMAQRWCIGCHSLIQIIIGATIGVLLGWAYYELIKSRGWLPEGKNTKLY